VDFWNRRISRRATVPVEWGHRHSEDHHTHNNECELCKYNIIALLGEGEGEHYTQIIHTGTIAVGLLHASGGWGRLTSSLGGELLTRSLSSGGKASSLLGTGHGSGCGVRLLLLLLYVLFVTVALMDFYIFQGHTNSSVSDALQIQPNRMPYLSFR